MSLGGIVSIGAAFTGAAEFLAMSAGFNLVHKSINGFTTALTTGTQRAVEFERSIAEITTITLRTASSFEAMASSAEILSNSFGVSVLKVAAGAYEAISNQVISGAEAVHFMSEALKFAQTTTSTASQAVDLISSGLNAFGHSSLYAAETAATFFAIIEVGRVKAEQMSNVLGTAAPLATALGIELRELGAGVAMLTSQGTMPNTSLTLMSNIMLKLIKPSTEMEGLFRAWGVTSGEAAIATFGFAGVLRKLGEEMDKGGLTRMGDLLKDIRAIRGVTGLLNETTAGSFEDIEAQIKASAASYDVAADLMKDPNFYKYSKELEKIANVLTTDFGRTAIEIFLRLSDAMGGAANAIKFLTDATMSMLLPMTSAVEILSYIFTLGGNVNSLIGDMGQTLIGFTLVLGGTTTAVWLLAGSLALLNPYTAGFVLAAGAVMGLVAALSYLGIAAKNTEKNLATARIEQDIETYKKLTAIVVAEAKAFEKAQNDKLQAYLKLSAALNRGIQGLSLKGDDNQENKIKEMNAALEDTIRITGEVTASFNKRDRDLAGIGNSFHDTTMALDASAISALNVLMTYAGASKDQVKDAGKLRDMFAEVRKEVEKLNDHLNKALERNRKYMADARTAFDARRFDIASQGPGSKAKIQAEINRLVGEAQKATSVDDAIPILDRAEQLAERLTAMSGAIKIPGFNTTKQAAEELQVLRAKERIMADLKLQDEAAKPDEKGLQNLRLTFEASITNELNTRIAGEETINKTLKARLTLVSELQAAQKALFDVTRKNTDDSVKTKQAMAGILEDMATQVSFAREIAGETTASRAARAVQEGATDGTSGASIPLRLTHAVFTSPSSNDLVTSMKKLVEDGDIEGLKKLVETLTDVAAGLNDLDATDRMFAQIKVFEAQIKLLEKSQTERPKIDALSTEYTAELDRATAELQAFVGTNFPALLKEVVAQTNAELKTTLQQLEQHISNIKTLGMGGPVPLAPNLGLAFATGGMVPGNGFDNTRIRASGGEIVMNKDISQRMSPYLLGLNSGRGSTMGQQGDIFNQHITVNGAKGPDLTASEIERRLRRDNRRGNFKYT